jgi:hypothetical protein
LGSEGPAGTLLTRQLATAEELWRALRASTDVDAGEEWSAHRTRVGEFHFRRYRPGEATSNELAERAATEFATAILLDPSNAKASTLEAALLGRGTPIGFPREYDLIPDFPRYEDVVTDYLAVVATLFLSAQILLQNASSAQRVREQVEAQKARLEGSIAVLTIEMARAELGLEVARVEVRKVDQRRGAVQQRLEERREELESAEWSELLGNVFELAIGLVATVATSGAALPYAAAAASAAFGILVVQGDGDRQTFTEIDFRTESVSVGVAESAGGLDKLKELGDPARKVFFSAAKVFDDIDAASADPEYKALMREIATLAFERQAASLRERQARLEVAAAELELAQARADLARIAALRDGIAADITLVGELTRSVIKRTQGYVDVIIKYIFFAGRALELFSLSDEPSGISFDYGYVDPDIEDDAFRSLSRAADVGGGPTKALTLLASYTASWQRLPDILVLRDRFESYTASGQAAHDVQMLSISDPPSLKVLRDTNELLFTLDVTNLPPSRYEDKVESVFLAFVGAKTKHPGVTCILEHGGQWTTRRRDGTHKALRLPPRRTPVLAASSRREADWLTFQRERTDVGFFGRGTATTWRLALEPHEAATNTVDLGQVSEVLIGIGYRSFLQ